MSKKTIHDKAYKYLFSNPFIVKELLESFVGMDWVQYIDFAKAQPIDKSYVNDEYKEYEADIIYKLQFENSEIYLYLLIEFQSTVDRFMAFRMLNYVMELYRELYYKQGQKRLPVVFPLLIYNGDKKWNAAIELQHLIEIPEELIQIKQYIPQFKYYPIIENELSRKELEEMMNVVATIFLFESSDKEKFLKTIDRIEKLMQIYSKDSTIIRTLLVWLLHYLKTHSIIGDVEPFIEKTLHPKETYTMLSKTLETLKEDLRMDGYKEGMKMGIREGLQKGLQKGFVQGVVKGKKEGLMLGISKERIKIAQKMLKNGIDDATILKITKIEKKDLEQLKKKN
jgi:predicted transposase/invertase (TIGR01784 family)